MFFGSKKKIIAIDVGSRSAKLVQLAGKNGRFRLLALGKAGIDTPPGEVSGKAGFEPLARRLRALVSNVRLSPRGVVLSFSHPSFFLEAAELPPLDERVKTAVLRWEAAQYSPYAPDELILDNAAQLGGGDEWSSAMITGVAQQPVRLFQQALAARGFSLAAVVSPHSALANLGLRLQNGVEQPLLLLHLGYSTSIAVLLAEGRLLAGRQAPLGGAFMDAEIAAALDIQPAAAERMRLRDDAEMIDPGLFDEVEQNVVAMTVGGLIGLIRETIAPYYNELPSSVRASGGLCHYQPLTQALESALKVPLVPLGPNRVCEYDNSRLDRNYVNYLAPLAAVAMGSAVGALSE